MDQHVIHGVMLDWLLPYPFVDLSNGGLGRVILTTLVIGLVLAGLTL